MIANVRGVNTPTIANAKPRCDIKRLAKLLKMKPLNLERWRSRVLASQSPRKREKSRERALVGGGRRWFFFGLSSGRENGGGWAHSLPLSSSPPAEGEMAGELA